MASRTSRSALGAVCSLSGRARDSLRNDVLDHDHRAVDDDAEVHRAERQQVRGDAAQREADERREQRERNHDRDDQRGAQVAEEEKSTSVTSIAPSAGW